jgi:predicted PurR-regulated permease PerM
MDRDTDDQAFLGKVTAATIRVVLLGGWLAWCAQIVLPFLVPILWGAIIATAAYPLVVRLFPRRRSLGAACFGVVALTVIVTPAWLFFDSVADFVIGVGRQWMQGELKLPEPRADVATWPIIGPKLYALWTKSVHTPQSVVEAYLPQLRDAGRWLVKSLGGISLALLQSLFAVALAIAFLVKADTSVGALLPVLNRIAPHRGEHILALASATVRAVAKGVLGVAVLQAALAWLGMSVAGVPGAGAWALVLLILAVAQLPSALVLLPVVIYLFATASKPVAIGFLVWAVLVGLIDNVVKPLVLGRGAGVPMLVIVIGAIGGMLSSGIIGLFVGAVVLAVGYELFAAWVRNEPGANAPPVDLPTITADAAK